MKNKNLIKNSRHHFKKNSWSAVIDHPNMVCDCCKALLNSHLDHQYVDVITTTKFLILLQLLLKQSLPYFKIANQIYEGSIAQVIRNMNMISNNLMP